MVQFLTINFFSWISSIFVGFFKSSRFFCVTLYNRLPEDGPSSSEHVEVVKNYNISLTSVYFVGLYYTIILNLLDLGFRPAQTNCKGLSLKVPAPS